MEVPCPVPLLQPWSPVGYQVVQLPDGKGPPAEQPPQVILAEHDPGPIVRSAAPSSPVGYRVVVVADEKVPVAPRVRSLDIGSLVRPPRRSSPLNLWIPIAAIVLVVMLPALSLALMMASRNQARPQVQGFAAVVPQEMVVVPEAIRANVPAAIQAEVAAPAKLDVPAAAPAPREIDDPFDLANQAKPRQPARPDREAFATAVEFVRNAPEAARLAKQENKLTFILHLSGNFEDPGFT